MKLHLPTALRHALLALTALLSPAVVTTTLATATLAAISAPALADDLILNGNYTFDSNITVDNISLANGVTRAEIQPSSSRLTLTAESIIIDSNQNLLLFSGTYKVSYLEIASDSGANQTWLTLRDAQIIANEGIQSLLSEVKGENCINMSSSSIRGAGGSSSNDALLSSLINDKINPQNQARIYITKGHIKFDENTGDIMTWLGDGESADSGTVSATITSNLDSLEIHSIASDATLNLGSGSNEFALNIYELKGTVKTGRDLTITGISGWNLGWASIDESGSVSAEEGSTVSIMLNKINMFGGSISANTVTLDKVELYGGNISANTIIVKEAFGYDDCESTLIATNELQIQGDISLEMSKAYAGTTTIDAGKSLTLGTGAFTTGAVTINEGAKLTLGTTTNLKGIISNNGTLVLGGIITVDSTAFTPDESVSYSAGENGYKTTVTTYTVLTGNAATGTATWKIGDTVAEYEEGKVVLSGEEDTSVYYVASGTVDYGTDVTALATDSTKFCLKGGSLVLSKNLEGSQRIQVNTSSSVAINGGVTLSASQLDTSAAGVTLSGEGSYDMQGQELSGKLQFADGVALDAAAWKGTIYTGSTAQGAALNITALGNSQSTVYVGAQPVLRSTPAETVLESLTAAGVGTTVVPGSLTLQKGTSTADTLVVNSILTLGSADAVASLVAVAVDAQTLNVQLTDEVLSNQQTDTPLTLVTLEEGFNGMLTFNGSTETENVSSADNSLEYTLAWNDDSTVLTLTIQGVAWEPSSTYVTDQVKPTTHNGRAGVELMTEVYLNSQPQTDAPDGALAGILNAVDAATATDRDMAAVAGASTAALGMALSGDVERQLSAIRNRSMAGNNANTTTLADEKSGLVDTASPARFFAWVNAEGNRAEQDADSTATGYTLTSWGGTLGAGMQVNDKLSLGLALTAMHGNLQSDAPDSLKGDMDTTYVSTFARYSSDAWSHAFIGTVGTMEADYKRTVSHAAGSYSTTGDTNGTALGLMYEVSRSMQLSNGSSLSPVFNIAYRHTEVDSYNESGADAALNVGKQSMDTVTAGAGARYAAVVGQQTLNRACGFEARALVKYDLGDRQSTTSAGFAGRATRTGIESAEVGAFGVELGAGISVPVGTGSIFADAAVELKSDYTNMNGSVGYKSQF